MNLLRKYYDTLAWLEAGDDQTTPAGGQEVRIQWEYESQDFYGAHPPREYLNGFGAHGWEICSSHVISDHVAEIDGTRHFLIIFKRQKLNQ